MENKKNNNDIQKQAESLPSEDDLHSAAVINENGEEITITEEMIQEAITLLDKED